MVGYSLLARTWTLYEVLSACLPLPFHPTRRLSPTFCGSFWKTARASLAGHLTVSEEVSVSASVVIRDLQSRLRFLRGISEVRGQSCSSSLLNTSSSSLKGIRHGKRGVAPSAQGEEIRRIAAAQLVAALIRKDERSQCARADIAAAALLQEEARLNAQKKSKHGRRKASRAT